MRADKPIRLERQAGQVDLAIARRDARGEQSLAAETSYVLFSAIELEDLHGPPSPGVSVTCQEGMCGDHLPRWCAVPSQEPRRCSRESGARIVHTWPRIHAQGPDAGPVKAERKTTSYEGEH